VSANVLGTGVLTYQKQLLYCTALAPANKHGNSRGDGASADPAMADDRIARKCNGPLVVGRRTREPSRLGLSPMAQPPFITSSEVCFPEVFRNGVSGLRNDPGPEMAENRRGHLLDAGVASAKSSDHQPAISPQSTQRGRFQVVFRSWKDAFLSKWSANFA